MADTPSQATAAQSPAPEGHPTPSAAANAPTPAPNGAEGISIDDFAATLDGPGAPAPETPQSGSEVSKSTAATEGSTAQTSTAPGDEVTTETTGETADPEEAAEAADLEKSSKDEKVPKWVPERLAKNAEQKRLLREENASLKAAKEAAETALAEHAANAKAPAPSGPLAKFETPEALAAEHAEVISFLEWAHKPEAVDRYVHLGEGAEAKLEEDRAYALNFLKHKDAQGKILTERSEKREAVRKALPALFDGKSPESQERAAFYAVDPRTRADYDQWIADALQGKRDREDAAAGKIRINRIDLAAAKANGAAGAAAAAKAKDQKTPPVFTPPGRSGPVPVRTAEQPDAAAAFKTRAAKEGVTADEMMDAGIL